MNGLKELARVISEVELPKLTRRVRPHGFPKVDMSKYGDRYDDGDEDEGDEDEEGGDEEGDEGYIIYIDIDVNMSRLAEDEGVEGVVMYRSFYNLDNEMGSFVSVKYPDVVVRVS